MTVIRSRGSKSVRAAVIATAAVAGLVLGNGTASAAVDNSNSIVDGSDNTITVSQSDTFINAVAPLDGNPLTREWFHNGRAGFEVTGPDAADFSGTMSIGYQVGYPAAIDPTITFGYETPNFSIGGDNDYSILDGGGIAPITGGNSSFSSNNLLPSAGISLPISTGGGVVEVEAASGSISGESGSIALSNFHGQVSGVLGNVSIRPYVKIVSDNGDTVVTYGTPWRLN